MAALKPQRENLLHPLQLLVYFSYSWTGFLDILVSRFVGFARETCYSSQLFVLNVEIVHFIKTIFARMPKNFVEDFDQFCLFLKNTEEVIHKGVI